MKFSYAITALFLNFIENFAVSLQFFPTAEESIDYYNQKRCVDGKGLVLPSQIVSLCLIGPNFFRELLIHVLIFLLVFQRYVKYFERILTYFNGENQPGRRYTSHMDFASTKKFNCSFVLTTVNTCCVQVHAKGFPAS